MERAGYSATIGEFLDEEEDAIIGQLVAASSFAIELTQRDAWKTQIGLLKTAMLPYRDRGAIYFEFSIPRLGKRIDVLAVIESAVFVIEFKVGERDFASHAIDQVSDYCLDLKNFHEGSHHCLIAPVLVATAAKAALPFVIAETPHGDRLLRPIACLVDAIPDVLAAVLSSSNSPSIDRVAWENSRYCPTPTIIEAAMALYGGHRVEEISRSDASAQNLSRTSATVEDIIKESRAKSRKSICFVTGVPGAGKTLVGLNIATKHIDKDSELYSVFLSGNGPLVAILREALARDKVQREKACGRSLKKGEARSRVKAFIQNVHHFRDECLVDLSRPPIEHVAIFDEAQRAWNRDQTINFMKRKKGHSSFSMSEPEFLISCLDRHHDWAVVVCLVGGGQEINTGEAGIGEWLNSVERSFPHWDVHISPRLTDSEYSAVSSLEHVSAKTHVSMREDLHLGVSMRSFRAESVSTLVKQLLDIELHAASLTLKSVNDRYPIALTRNLSAAKQWLRQKARGTERYGIVVSSEAQRLKPHAIDVRSPMEPVHWFLDGKEDVRSSYYLEDVATEFHVQGLELDWACVTWDADLRFSAGKWEHWSFVGARWNKIKKAERKTYLKNAYRVLLTRARQGMVIVVPEGAADDPTRKSEFYDETYGYLRSVGFQCI